MKAYELACVVVFAALSIHQNTVMTANSTTSILGITSTPGLITLATIPVATTSLNGTVSPATTSLNGTVASATTSLNGTVASGNGTSTSLPTAPPTTFVSSPAVSTGPPSTAPTDSSTGIWDTSVQYLGNLWSFVIIVAALGLCIVLFIALLCLCCAYRRLKKKTKFPTDVIINNESAWINSNDDLLMWERNLRANEMNPAVTNGNRPTNDKRK